MSLSRRNFLLASAAAAGATWFDVPQILADTREESHRKYGGFPMGIQSYSLRAFGVDGAIEIIGKDLNLHYVEFFRLHFPPTGDPAEIKAMKDKLAKYDIAISAHGVQKFTKNHQTNEDFFRFAKAAGIRNISADPDPDSFEDNHAVKTDPAEVAPRGLSCRSERNRYPAATLRAASLAICRHSLISATGDSLFSSYSSDRAPSAGKFAARIALNVAGTSITPLPMITPLASFFISAKSLKCTPYSRSLSFMITGAGSKPLRM